MDLAISKTNDHKALMCQGEVSDAFIKSNYYVVVLIKADAQSNY